MPKSHHQHPGQDEPRAYGPTRRQRLMIDDLRSGGARIGGERF